MPVCIGCGGEENVQTVFVHNWGTDIFIPAHEEPYCVACLTILGIYCERHRSAHVCAHDTSVEVDEPYERSVCQTCAFEVLRTMTAERKKSLIDNTEDRDCEICQKIAREFAGDWSTALSEDDRAILGLVITATLDGKTVDEFIESVYAG